MIKNNHDMANALYQYADLLEDAGQNPYKTRAYRRAAKTILALDENILELMQRQFDVTTLRWVGKGIASMLEYVAANQKLPELHVNSNAKPFHIAKKHKNKKPFLRFYHAVNIVHAMTKKFNQMPDVTRVAPCGEYRRRKEVCGELIFVIETKDINATIEQCMHLYEVVDIVQQSPKHLVVSLWAGIQLKLFFVNAKEFAHACILYTGSTKHLEALANLARGKDDASENPAFSNFVSLFNQKTEVEIYQTLGLSYIEPELREGKGEIEAACNNQLPVLVELEDIRGDLHSHTTETDGNEPLEVMIEAAEQLGYEYYAITDHSKHLTITHGMDEKRLYQQINQIDALNAKHKRMRILKSIEVDILEDGTLDLDNDVLKELDIVVASIHSKFRLSKEKQTERILKAMDNPYFNILGHATGRLIYARTPYEIDMPRLLKAAKERGCYLELNTQPYRLDIHDEYCRLAKKYGVKVAISSDAHSIRNLQYIQLGIYQARRGWLEKEDVLNTYPWEKLKKLLKRH